MKAIRPLAIAAAWLLGILFANAQLTLEHCIERARANYPLIKKFDLVNRTEEISLSDINKGWLPHIGLFAQATAQNSVSAFPDALKAMLDKTGTSVAGMGKVQYNAGIELNQTIWDGGHAKAQRQVQRATTAQSKAALEVEMYALRQKIESIFFGILLLDEQMAKMQLTIALLQSNHTRLQSMVAGGIAMQSDADMIEAQILTMSQQLTEARSAAHSYRRILELYIDESTERKTLIRPADTIPTDSVSYRPELTMFSRQIELNNRRAEAIGVSLMPRIALFAQAHYGYPGFNIFESMMRRSSSFNALAGVKVSWNIDSFYTRNNSRKRLSTASDLTRTDRDLFLFNTRLKSTREQAQIENLRSVMANDSRIVELRGNVRKAAESQLAHGIIDANALLIKITDENQAILNQTLHEIQFLQTIYQLKNTLNQ